MANIFSPQQDPTNPEYYQRGYDIAAAKQQAALNNAAPNLLTPPGLSTETDPLAADKLKYGFLSKTMDKMTGALGNTGGFSAVPKAQGLGSSLSFNNNKPSFNWDSNFGW